jgi:chemotaxis protein CheC
MIRIDVALTTLERDALTELVNIGVSRAAVALRKMVGEYVLLSVPAVEIIDHTQAASLIGERESAELVAVRQDFSGAFAGRALLIFPQSNSLELIRAVVGEELTPTEAADMENEALAETGNIILNGCLGTMANMLRRSLTLSLPEVLRGDGSTLFRETDPALAEGQVLFLYINFFVRRRNLRGYIAMLMDIPSLDALKRLIQEFIDSVMNDEPDLGADDASG